MNTSKRGPAGKIFKPEEYGMMFCTGCAGSGRRNFGETVTVCEACGGFGLIIKEQEKHDLYRLSTKITR
jgi:hypothetical protein